VVFCSNIEAPKDGWMRFRFIGETGEIDLLASYTPFDSFEELITALQALLDFGNSHKIRVNEEPKESVLTLSRKDDSLFLTLLDDRETHLTQIETSFTSGCQEIARNIYQLYKEVGHEGFEREWRHRPPEEKIKRLWVRVSSEPS